MDPWHELNGGQEVEENYTRSAELRSSVTSCVPRPIYERRSNVRAGVSRARPGKIASDFSHFEFNQLVSTMTCFFIC